MYPYDILPGFTLYDLCLALGIFCAVLVFRFFSDRDKISARLYNFILYDALITVVLGYALSVFTQALYNWRDEGKFVISASTGATFLGGLVGGAAVFIAFYFGIGHFSFGNRENIKSFRWMTDVAAVCIPAAHSIGRIGCLTAGCCHGIVYETAKWYTFRFLILNAADECIGVFYALPVQLYEALFLAVLALALGIMKRKNKTNLLPIYMIAYGVWRFLIEYIRGDERGTTIVDFLSPSQLTSVLMVAGGILLLVVMIKKSPKNNEETEK